MCTQAQRIWSGWFLGARAEQVCRVAIRGNPHRPRRFGSQQRQQLIHDRLELAGLIRRSDLQDGFQAFARREFVDKKIEVMQQLDGIHAFPAVQDRFHAVGHAVVEDPEGSEEPDGVFEA